MAEGDRQRSDYPSYGDEFLKCREFLQKYSEGEDNLPYQVQLQEIANRERKQLEVDVDDILRFNNDEEFANNVKRNSLRYMQHFEKAAMELMPPSEIEGPGGHKQDVFDILYQQRKAALEQARANDENEANRNDPIEVDVPACLTRRFDVCILPSGKEKRAPKKLRDVRASDIGHLVCVKGMVTRATDVKPQVRVCTYICELCGSEIYQPVHGQEYMPKTKCPAPRCKENASNGRVSLQARGSKFVKYQELRVQELPDQVPVGHIPRSITVHCKGEQTRQCVPGDKVTISGVFLAQRFGGFKGIMAGLQSSTYLDAYHIEKEKQSYKQMDNEISIDEMQEVYDSPNAYNLLAASIAPEIFGHTDVKKALLLQLVGGTTRVLGDGMKIRGDLNICLMGDPGVAKSQLLKYISTVAPRGVYTTGKGSSGVGLTAAVVKDQLTGELSLEGGALVLADMGICCIDEFDKMDESDRTAIHEVMEQQTISIAKAGITTTLNARAAVLAAANPLHGRYNKRRSISENVDLPNSLLSRFDLMFLLLDKADMDNDLALARHVLHVHRFKKNPERDFTPMRPTAVKHYVSLARRSNPVVPARLTEHIVEQYVDLRSKDASSTGHSYRRGATDQAVMTARQLLSILRLGQALARLRLADEICAEDIDEALRLTKASKSSLEDDTRSLQQEDPTSAIFTIMKEAILNRAGGGQTGGDGSLEGGMNPSISFNDVEARVVHKGFTADQLKRAIDEYKSLNVIDVDESMTRITML